MSNKIEMQKKRADLAKQMRNLVDQTDSAKGMTSEQESQWNAMEKDLNNLDASIKRETELENIENTLDDLELDPHRPLADQTNEQSPFAASSYLASFDSFVRGGLTPDINAALSIGTDSEGGFTVPESWDSKLREKLTDAVVMRGLSTVIQTSSTKNFPGISDNGSAGWLDENAAYPESDMAFANLQLQAWKLGRIMKVSEELMQDTVYNLVDGISKAFAKTFGLAENTAFIAGDGVSKPRGVLLDAQNGLTAASATAIVYDEIVDLIHSVKQVYRANASFLMNDTTLGMLRKLKSTDGVPLWQPSIQAGVPDRLLGKLVNTDDAMPVVATGNKSIAFGDFSEYHIADRGAIYMQRLNELYAGTGQVGFRMRKRVDGRLMEAEAVKTLTQL
jgi:HK97 family phage major capsid protein